MGSPSLILALLGLSSVSYYLGWRRSISLAQGTVRNLHSLPGYHGLYTALWAAVPALLLLAVGVTLQGPVITRIVVADLPREVRNLPPERLNLVVNDIRNLASGNIASRKSPAMIAAAERYARLQGYGAIALTVAVLALATACGAMSWRTIKPGKRARNAVERTILGFLMASSTIAILTTVGIVLSVLFESLRFFQTVPLHDFLFGVEWSPQTAIRADQVGASGAFGAAPLFAGTLLISFIAMLVAVPVGLMSAIYLTEYARPRVRAVVKPLLEVLAGIPTVVYGFFAALTVAPVIRGWGEALGLDVASESALAAGLGHGVDDVVGQG